MSVGRGAGVAGRPFAFLLLFCFAATGAAAAAADAGAVCEALLLVMGLAPSAAGGSVTTSNGSFGAGSDAFEQHLPILSLWHASTKECRGSN